MKCTTCKKETNNPKFCSKSCSAIWTNKHYVKSKPKIRFCVSCKKELPVIRGKLNQILVKKYCSKCSPRVNWDSITKSDMISLRNYQVHSRIRELAQKVFRDSSSKRECKICGYNLHIEICHKKAIKDFPSSAKISEINSVNNLVALCPNHHWEFDNGLIELPM